MYRRLAVVALLAVVFATPASAGCAWVLWTVPLNPDGRTYQRDKLAPVDAFDTREACVARLATATGNWHRVCLPDTIDPRRAR